MNPLAWIKSGCDAVAAVFNWATGRSAAKNTQAMQDNAAAAMRQKIADDAAQAIARQAIDDERKLGAE